jgi:acetyl-CoA acetyltransferase
MMGIGPAPAIRNALKAAKLTLDQMDLIEVSVFSKTLSQKHSQVNEAFAAQAVAVQRELKIPQEKYNVNGGAVAVGHPLGASGTRITVHLCHELMCVYVFCFAIFSHFRRRKVKYAVGSACIGGGQGIALILERVL